MVRLYILSGKSLLLLSLSLSLTVTPSGIVDLGWVIIFLSARNGQLPIHHLK